LRRAHDAAQREVAHHAVRDPQDARDLVERRGVAVERDEVVRTFGLLVDLVGELAPATGVLALPRAAALLDQVADALDDLLLALVGQVGVQHEQYLVVDHVPGLLPSGSPRS
jgi:hypothetical protein